ncbi:hypothetical protein [Bacillus cereus]|uniref:Uncharacterized protein n=1 Tax=Bacillus cereus TaxID=1396 RepID=A0A2B1KNY6_BACCE|nr:hypothetical protein [Bacillus cereus]PFN27791.1 hypothetical protein COJ50_06615 [Bacillus cereus]
MLTLNYHFDRFLYFDTREDRLRCDTTINAEFEGERIIFNCEFYSIGKQTEWRTGTIFENVFVQKDFTQLLRPYFIYFI